MYSRTVVEHFTNPRHVGAMEHADGYARVKSDLHDDVIDLYIKVADGHIVDITFRTYGCVAAIASSSMTAELVKGLSLEDAAQVTEGQVVEALGGLPENKIQCSVLAPEALRQALADYQQKHPRGGPQ